MSDIAIITVDYRCIIHNTSKSEAINLLKNSEDHGFILKNIVVNFSLIKAVFLNFFFVLLYIKWLSEYSMDIHKTAKISIGTVMRNPKNVKVCR